MTLRELRDEIRCKTLHNRSMETVINSVKFEQLWEGSTIKQREEVTLYIQFGHKSKVISWIKGHGSLSIGERPLVWLRERAHVLRVKNYSRLSRGELIAILEENHD